MVTAIQITEWQRQRKIKKLVWDMACSATDRNTTPFNTYEYDDLFRLGWRFEKYKNFHEWMSLMSVEEQVLFTLMIYYSLP